MVTVNTGNTPLNSNVHINLLPKLANPSEMALTNAHSRQASVCCKTWEFILKKQNSDVRKARPEISNDIFGLCALFLPWQFQPSHCQTRHDPPVNLGSKNPRFSWGLNASEGERIDPIMRCKLVICTQGNSLQYCKFPCFTSGRAEVRSSQAFESACLNTYSPMQAMRTMYKAPSQGKSDAKQKRADIIPNQILSQNSISKLYLKFIAMGSR